MDEQTFFDGLYSQVCLPLPMFAARHSPGGPVATKLADGRIAALLFTDGDLLQRFLAERDHYKGVRLETVGEFDAFLAALPVDVVVFDRVGSYRGRAYKVDTLREFTQKRLTAGVKA